jgi:hypothetical protein
LARNSLFAGVETIFFGDFAQLPPVDPTHSAGAFYQSEIFKRATKLVLTEPQRQRDPDFIRILNKVRVYDLDKEVTEFIFSRMVDAKDIPVDAVRLYSTNDMVDQANWNALQRFHGTEVQLESEDYITGAVTIGKKALESTHLDSVLRLKLGVPLMLLHNINVAHGWTNGALLTLLDIGEPGLKVQHKSTGTIRWINKISRIVPVSGFKRTQYPVTLAFSSTVHKSQSMTLDKVAIHYSHMKTHGQLYVSMSRVRTANDIYFFGFDRHTQKYVDLNVDMEALTVIHELSRT